MNCAENLSTALFVKGLAKGATERHLHAIFSQFGVVDESQIARHRSGRSAGFAIVTFRHREDADVALSRVDNSLFLGRHLMVRWFQQEREALHLAQITLGPSISSNLHALSPGEMVALASWLGAPEQTAVTHSDNHFRDPYHARTSLAGSSCGSIRQGQLQHQHASGDTWSRSSITGQSQQESLVGAAEYYQHMRSSSCNSYGHVEDILGQQQQQTHELQPQRQRYQEQQPQQQQQQLPWSSMVTSWLDDFTSQHPVSARGTDAQLPAVLPQRHSHDGSTPTQGRRTSRTHSKPNQQLDGLDLAAHVSVSDTLEHPSPLSDDPASLGKSRLTTKWTVRDPSPSTTTLSGGGASLASACSSGGAAAVAAGARRQPSESASLPGTHHATNSLSRSSSLSQGAGYPPPWPDGTAAATGDNATGDNATGGGAGASMPAFTGSQHLDAPPRSRRASLPASSTCDPGLLLPPDLSQLQLGDPTELVSRLFPTFTSGMSAITHGRQPYTQADMQPPCMQLCQADQGHPFLPWAMASSDPGAPSQAPLAMSLQERFMASSTVHPELAWQQHARQQSLSDTGSAQSAGQQSRPLRQQQQQQQQYGSMQVGARFPPELAHLGMPPIHKARRPFPHHQPGMHAAAAAAAAVAQQTCLLAHPPFHNQGCFPSPADTGLHANSTSLPGFRGVAQSAQHTASASQPQPQLLPRQTSNLASAQQQYAAALEALASAQHQVMAATAQLGLPQGRQPNVQPF
ncbi:MAG: hypothetical protein WDW36_003033 [Sanguina aurantia]